MPSPLYASLGFDEVALPAQTREVDKPFYNDAYEVLRQGGAGVAVDLPRMIGQGLRWGGQEDVGRDVVEWANRGAEQWDPDFAGRGPVASTLMKGSRALGPMATAVAGTAINPFLGAGLAAAQFGMSSAQDTEDKLRLQGVSDDAATQAGWRTGLIQGAGEGAATALTGGLFRAGRAAYGAAPTVGGIVSRMTDTAVLKPFAKGMGLNLLAQPATEVAQDLGTEWNERSYGAKPEDAWGIAKDSAQGAVGMTLLLGPFSFLAHRGGAQRAQVMKDVLMSPDAPIELRQQVWGEVEREAKRAGVDTKSIADWVASQQQHAASGGSTAEQGRTADLLQSYGPSDGPAYVSPFIEAPSQLPPPPTDPRQRTLMAGVYDNTSGQPVELTNDELVGNMVPSVGMGDHTANYDLLGAPQVFGNEIDFTNSHEGGQLNLQPAPFAGTERTQNLFPGMTPQSGVLLQQSAPGFLQPSGDLDTQSQQRELDLQPPMDPMVSRTLDDIHNEQFKKNGGQRQLPFSAATASPKGQVLMGLADSLLGEQHLDESTHVQVSTMIAQSKFAAAKKVLDEALKEKAAADTLIAKVEKLAEKEVNAQQTKANQGAAPTSAQSPANTIASSAPAAAGTATSAPVTPSAPVVASQPGASAVAQGPRDYAQAVKSLPAAEKKKAKALMGRIDRMEQLIKCLKTQRGA